MPDDLPPMIYSLSAEGTPIVVVGTDEVGSQTEILQSHPDLVTTEQASALAKVVNHFAREFRYEVIEDPAAYEDAYRSQVAAEDADAEFQQGKPRLRDFGIPDFTAILAPHFDGATLVYYARDRYLGIPYRASVAASGDTVGTPSYTPMALSEIR
ncbi:MAG: hypothetical protein AAGC57_05995 [Pseudomonadota bacterium]